MVGVWLFAAAFAAPAEPATAPLAPLEGHWHLSWARPAGWWPAHFSGMFVVRQVEGVWTAALNFDQTEGRFTLSDVGTRDGKPLLRFSVDGSQTFEVTLALSKDGKRLEGQARWPGAINEWTHAGASPVLPVPAVLPGPVRVPVQAPPPAEPATLPAADAYQTGWPVPPLLSGDGKVVWVRRGGQLHAGSFRDLALKKVTDNYFPDWQASDPKGEHVYCLCSGGLYEIAAAGGVRSVLDAVRLPLWLVPRWESHSLLVAQAAENGVRVVEVSLPDGGVAERFAHESASDVVLAPDLSPRFLVDREYRHRYGVGVFADRVTLRTPDGKEVGPLRQPAWLRRTEIHPRVGEAPVVVLGGGDLVTLQQITPGASTPRPSPDQWGDAITFTTHPQTGVVDAVGWSAERLHWEAHTRDGEELPWLQAHLNANVDVLQRTGNDRRWVIEAWSGHRPASYWLFDRDTRSVREVRDPSDASGRSWHPTEPIALKARDGAKVAAYLTRPSEGEGPWPTVVLIHGGPWSGRHDWRFDRRAQQWADRGYATLAVDFRGTHGFGWGRMEGTEYGDDPMMHDVEDGIRHAIAVGVADPARIAAVGASYGGYASLRLATAKQPMIRCAAAGLVRGNITTPGGGLNVEAVKDASWREAHSPDRFTQNIAGPVLVWSGGRDGENPDAIQDFVGRARGKPVVWVRFPWEQHGVGSPANQRAIEVIQDRFLSSCLGGPAWDFSEDFHEAELEVRGQAALVPGLSERLR